MKPKQTQASDTTISSVRDRCQTPAYALTPLLPYLPKPPLRVWESAAGEGLLAAALRKHGYTVTESDILTGQNYFTCATPDGVQFEITNLPFSVKYKWLKHSCLRGLPFAYLVPGDVLFAARAQRLITKYNLEAIIPDQRIDFKMPNAGWENSSAQFTTIWLTRGLNIGQTVTFAKLNKPTKAQLIAERAGQLTLFEAVIA